MEREQAERSGIRTSSSTDSDTETVSEADLCCNSEDPESDPEHVEPRRCGALLTLHEQKGKQESENDSTEDRMRNKDKEHEVDEEEDEMLDNILSPPPLPFCKTSNPEMCTSSNTSSSLPIKLTRQLSEDGRQLRRGSLGGALTGKYLLPYISAQQAWPTSGTESSNLVRMRSQSFGKSAPSLTASLGH
ncbi:microtubule-associated serine/threonine-protein kinase 4-like [Silurus meridionalis]|uniref:microtubule-associated serine/threonine-protein kinase 4-like n=1 Tax=Silurus meridionalis TaxID=175797 RepID=UPI001EEB8066|nr:microtubule-associated serine/threonine-protein kinase 4-like [Silurus meridionalis]